MSSDPIGLGALTSQLASTAAKNVLNSGVMLDAVGKLRTSTPENMIDTDFEYGLQTGKWETLELINNIPTFFARDGDQTIPVSDVQVITDSFNVFVTTTNNHGLIVGSPTLIVGLREASAEGINVILSVPTTNTFIYKAKSKQSSTGSIFDVFSTQLYVARIFQGAQYNLDNIISMETDGGNDDGTSLVTVVTTAPHGFEDNSSFILTNSVGQKEVQIDAQLIDSAETITKNFTVTTTTVTNQAGYSSRAINPYDFQSKKTVFFTSNEVDIPYNKLYLPLHNLETDMKVMYVAPVGDTAIGGLINYRLYNVSKLDDNNVRLSQSVTPMVRGATRFGHNSATATIAYLLNPVTIDNQTTNANFIDHINGAFTISVTSDITTAFFYYTISINTYYVAPASGTYRFRFESTGNTTVTSSQMRVWIGDSAVNATDTNWLYQQANTTALISSVGSFEVVQGGIYPIRIVLGVAARGDGATAFTRVSQYKFSLNNTTTYIDCPGNAAYGQHQIVNMGQQISATTTVTNVITTTINHYFATGTRVQYLQGSVVLGALTNNAIYFTRYITSNTLKLYTTLENAAADTGAIVIPASVVAAGNAFLRRLDEYTNVTFTSQGTSAFGNHALLKAYQVISAQARASVNIDMNLSNYLDANLAASDRLVLFSGLSRTSYIYATDVTLPNVTLDIEAKGFGLKNTFNAKDNFQTNSFQQYFIKGNPNVGAIETTVQLIPNATQTSTAISWPGPAITIPWQKYLMFQGLAWCVPVQVLNDLNSIYISDHGFVNTDVVALSLLSGTLPIGLAQQNYNISVLTKDTFQLLTLSQVVDIRSISTASIQFLLTKANPTAGTIYVNEHGFYLLTAVMYTNNGNTSIPGLTQGQTYYIIDPTEHSFRLSSTTNVANRIQFSSNGVGIHSLTSTQRATDGTFKIQGIINSRSFALYYPFIIPIRVIEIDPRKTMNLNLNLVNLASHKMRTGNEVVYDANGGADIGGLTSGTKYYIIRVDTDHIRLALSASDASNNIEVIMTSNGSGSSHSFSISSVCGELITSTNVTLTQNSKSVTAASEDLLATARVGDILRVEIVNPQVSFVVSTLDSVNDIVTFTAAHGLVDGQDIRFVLNLPSVVGGLVNGYIYYVRVTGLTTPTTQVQLFATKSDSLSAINRIDITTTTVGAATFIRTLPNTIFESVMMDIRDSFNVSVDANAPATTTVGRFIRTTSLYPRTDGFALHRPYDGGVEMIPSGNPYSQLIRQTRKYFRYQSGKGLQFSSAVNFSGPIPMLRLFRDGDLAVGLTRRPHRMTVGLMITISGAKGTNSGASSWNGVFEVLKVPTDASFVYRLQTIPDDVTASGVPSFVVNGWVNAVIRSGLFDLQNGMGFVYDGDKLYVFRRNSMQQLPGACTVQFNSNRVDGDINTRYLTTVSQGDNIVIRGQTYRVVAVENNNLLYVQPAYRGISTNDIIISKTVDVMIPQSEWNMDRMDGTGASGYNLNIHKIQMTYIDYSWYGAGAIRFGFRAIDGAIVYVHTMAHNNQQDEAYMRSGNIPGRYEVATTGTPTYIPILMHWGTSVIMDGRFDDDKAYWFTASAKLLFFTGAETDLFVGDNNSWLSTTTLANGTNEAAYRLLVNSYNKVQYIQPGTLVTGATAGVQAGTYTVGYPVKRATPGNIVDSTGYIWLSKPRLNGTLATTAQFTIGTAGDTIPKRIPLVSIRLSPSADNNRPGVLGSREIINRMQLQLKKIGILSTHDIEVTLLLNAYPYTKSWQANTAPSLSQVLLHEKGDIVNGGTEIFSFRVQGGDVDAGYRHFSTTTNFDLDNIADLGNSILGGDGTFPNGPDILTITAKLLDFSGITASAPFVTSARISWTESQA
jgi:hypothetical protein